MKLFAKFFFFSVIFLPVRVFSQNPVYLTGGNVSIIYSDPLVSEQNKYILFNLTGDFFSATSTTNGRDNFITEIIRYPKAVGNAPITETAGPSQRGNVNQNGFGLSNIYFSSQSASENTNFKFRLQYAIPKLTPNENSKFVSVPFTMTGRIICFSSDANSQSIFTRQVYGSGIVNLRFDRVRDFNGKFLRKIYLANAGYEFLNQPFPE